MARSNKRWGTPAMLLGALAVSLAGCGSSAPNRVGGGTAGGAATGATFGLIGGPIGVLIGAGIGGGIGALTAANTSSRQIDLGNPPWNNGGSRSGGNGQQEPQYHSGAAAAPSASGNPGYRQPKYRSDSSGSAPAYDNRSYGQPQSLAPASGSQGYGGGVQSQPLPSPSTR